MYSMKNRIIVLMYFNRELWSLKKTIQGKKNPYTLGYENMFLQVIYSILQDISLFILHTEVIKKEQRIRTYVDFTVFYTAQSQVLILFKNSESIFKLVVTQLDLN